MLKITGMILVFLSGACAGLAGSVWLNQRVASFEQIERLISYLETQIRYSGAPIHEILQQTLKSDFRKLKFLKVAADLMRNGVKPDEAWKTAISMHCEDNGFTSEDRELIFDFGRGLGSSDTEGQIKHCRTYRQLFQDRLQRARLDAQSKGKLYVTLGISGGLGAALLML